METKLTISGLIASKAKCQAPNCKEPATMQITYDHGSGPENTMKYCDPHTLEEQGNVELDNRNIRAGFTLI